MSMENIRDLILEDETFEDARNKFNTVLQRLFRSMIDTESNEGSITLKMDVSMQTEFIPNHDPDVEGESRQIRLPQFAYKVSSSITVKDEQKGNKNPQMELVWDEKQQKYVLQYVANTEQRSIFDKEVQIISGGVESNGCRYFQHRQEIPDHIRRPSVVGNRRRKDKERSRPALSADENAGDHRTARSGVNRPGRVPPLPVGYEQPPERCLCSHGGLGLPVCNDNYLAERQGWSGAVLPWNDGTLSVRNHKKETAV